VAEEGWLPVDEARRRREECEEEVERLVEELFDSSADESEGGEEYRDRAVPQMEEHARRRLCQASSSSSDSGKFRQLMSSPLAPFCASTFPRLFVSPFTKPSQLLKPVF